jgi:NADPH:quinone reductase-like Zn-dependent oxidoreductase
MLHLARLTLLALLPFAAQEKSASSMKAVRMHDYGKADVLVLEDAPRPQAKPNEVLVKVHAAGVNPVDWKIRAGSFGKAKAQLPLILGGEIAGVVESCGADVKGFKPGDEVWALLSLARWGGYAEYAVVPESELAKKPKGMDFVHAAGVPLAALTAWQALVDTAGLKEGQTVLIHAGAGGVGHFAIQIAKAKGAKVIATASANHLAFLKELGADVTIDYKAQKFEDVAKDVDVVLDSIGGDTQARSLGCLKKGGFLVSIVQPPVKKKLDELGVRGAIMLVKADVKELDLLAQLIEAKKLKCVVSETVPLAEAKRAHELSETGHTQGKIVLQVVK